MNVRRLNRRISTITGGKLEHFRNFEQLTLRVFKTLVAIRVLCEDCGTSTGERYALYNR